MNSWYFSHLVLIQSTFISFLLALSIQVPLRAGVFSFAGVGSYAIGAYAAAILTIRAQVAPVLAIGAGILVAAVAGWLLALLVARLSGLYLGMATISFALFLGVLATNGGELTGGATGLYGAISTLTTTHVVVVSVLVALLLAASERGAYGRRVDAVREDPHLAVSLGIDVTRVRRRVFVVSGALGACAGGMNSLLRTTVSPETVGFHLVVTALTMIIVGGALSWAGAAIGAVVFTWLPSVLQFVGEWQLVVYGVVVAAAAVWVPGGLLGLVQDRWHRWQVRRRRIPAEGATAPVADVPADAEQQLAALGGPAAEARP
ncbi:branched-chain amino acid transport system permease protein [Geodermatophilus dictyosporus]|uniref:Branched-chain amino acid transport system permease protein n=1 Tax=Geodermatophilus dictyosporus TaxID=1523247 RepID=A0A1I5QU81_9ACTN|nr:branched-chain amino acid ABC transporter permease [Geodermatophilus dictyosporus]SFP49844.1 branched-chain amino acid transport system permease protein [Geodermatophilus dictyosporus]